MGDATLNAGGFDMAAYLERIGYGGPLRPDREVLEALHLAHATHIPFENLDILLGRGIRLDLPGVQAKLVAGRRGGYCFEQNLLFSHALRAAGFTVTDLAARVRYGTRQPRPRTHMCLLVQTGDGQWLADVGFGGEGLLLPVPLVPGRLVNQFTWTYRVVAQAGLWVLQTRRGDGWLDMYAFTLEPQLASDYEMANYYTSTHPDSAFVRTLTAQLPTPAARHVLRDRHYVIDTGTAVTDTPITNDRMLLDVLADTFHLRLPAATRFPAPGAGG